MVLRSDRLDIQPGTLTRLWELEDFRLSDTFVWDPSMPGDIVWPVKWLSLFNTVSMEAMQRSLNSARMGWKSFSIAQLQNNETGVSPWYSSSASFVLLFNIGRKPILSAWVRRRKLILCPEGEHRCSVCPLTNPTLSHFCPNARMTVNLFLPFHFWEIFYFVVLLHFKI